MRTVVDIYKVYKIPPWLQEHQLRVAAVGKIVADAFEGAIDADFIVQAGLFHDMGNILKMQLTPENPLAALVGDEMEYWQGVQAEYRAKYGPTEKEATSAIARELGLAEGVVTVMEMIGFGKTRALFDDPSYERKIAEYGDLRTGPRGIMTVRDRANEGRNRYAERMRAAGHEPNGYFDALIEDALRLEAQIFERCRIVPEDIDDASIAPRIDELRDYKVV